MKAITKYVADDGSEFGDADACRAYENEMSVRAIVGLDEGDVSLALQRHKDFIHVSDALERAGSIIARARLASGEKRRERKPAAKAPIDLVPEDKRDDVVAYINARGLDINSAADVAEAAKEMDLPF